MMAGLGYVFINDNFVTKVARLLYRFGLHFTTHLLLLNEYSKTLVETKHLCAPPKMILLKGGEGINVTDYPQCDNASPTTTFCILVVYPGTRDTKNCQQQPDYSNQGI